MWLFISLAMGEELLSQTQAGTEIKELVVNTTGDRIAMLESNTGQIYFMSEADWDIEIVDVCSGTAGGLAFDSTGLLYVGCDGEGILSVDPMNDYAISAEAIRVDTEGFLSSAMYNDNLYVVAENPSGGNPRVHMIDLTAGEESATNYPTTLSYSSMSDMEQVGNYIVISHGGSSISKLDPNSGSITRKQDGPTMGTLGDVLMEENASNALLSAGTAGLMRFLFASNDTQLAATGADLDDVSALIANDPLLWVADSGSDSLKALSYTSGSATPGTTIEDEVDLGWDKTVQEMAILGDNLIVGAEDGAVSIIGSGPWVESSSASPAAISTNEQFSFSFTSSIAGDFEVRLNASSDSSGTVISSGSVDAGTDLSLTLQSSDAYKEGSNGLRIVVDSDEGTGHDTVYVTVDTPPSTPSFSKSDLGFGDQTIIISFDGISDEDLSHYIVYLSKEEFTVEDYPTGGPSFKKISESERTVTTEPSENVSLTLTGLENDVLYYVAVRAYDQGGMESEMSSVLSVTPKETLSAAELSGDSGGFCGISTNAGIFGLGVSMLLIGLRRKEWLAGLALLVFPQVGSATSQMADTKTDEKPPKVRQFTDVRYGPIEFQSQTINAVFTASNHQVLYIDSGYSFRDILGVSFGLGLVRERGYLLASDLSASTEGDMLNVIPLNLSVLIRGDLFKEQILVPYASAGGDYWLWQEKWGETGAKESIGGGKSGYHYAVGGQLLLDPFDRASASLMEVKRGVRDTYISVEYRKQEFLTSEGLNFDSDSVSFGFRFNY